jgi:hypothetical protein
MRRTQAMTALVCLVSGLVALVAPAASAQTGYPPGACTTLTGTQDVGTVDIGQRFILQLAPACVFTAGAAVTVTVNGVNIPGKVANASGFVLVDITVLSATQLSIDDPVLTPATCGVNTANATGPSAVAGGATVSQTANFTLNCEAVPAASSATPATGRLSRTGANVLWTSAAAAALLGVGALLVVVSRRRRASAF